MSMASCTLLIFGTPFGSWSAIARRLLAEPQADGRADSPSAAFSRWHSEVVDEPGTDAAAAWASRSHSLDIAARIESLDAITGSGDEAWMGFDERACWTIERLAPRLTRAQYLVFVESPGSALAAAFAMRAAGVPEEFLRAWTMGAESVRRHVQRRPERCLVVDVEEAMRSPEALAATCSARFGIDFVAPKEWAGMVARDTLRRALADSVVRADPRASTLFGELQASCVELVAGETVADPMSGLVPGEALAVHERLCGLEAAAVERERLSSIRAELDQRLEESRQALQELRRASEAETTRLAQRNLQVEQVSAEATRLAEGLQTELGRSLDERAQLRTEFDSLHRGLLEQRQENELLILELQQTQDRLERAQASGQQSEAAAATVRGSGASRPAMVAPEVHLVHLRDEPPHRELTLQFLQAWAGGRQLAELDARLVEHHGNPGLVIFSGLGRALPLKGWRESGTEGNRPYMLFVPADQDTRQRLAELPAADWQLLKELARAAADQLQRAAGLPARWPLVARRLEQQLGDLPPVLRYDDAEIICTDEARELDITLRDVDFGSRHVDSLRLVWGLGTREDQTGPMSMELFGGAGSLPLIGWPVNDDGTLPASVTLPFGKADHQSRRRQWAAMSPADRAFVIGLLEVLPRVLAGAPSEVLDGIQPARLTTTVAQLVTEGRQMARGPAWRQVARALLSRGVATA